jgi:uncharacterized protein YbjT (DUF2867 family)
VREGVGECAVILQAAADGGAPFAKRSRPRRSELQDGTRCILDCKDMNDRTAVVLGASGSVGQALLAELTRCGGFSRILVMTRRPLNLQLGAQVEERLVPDMEPNKLFHTVVDALRGVDGDVIGFSVLGVGAGTAKLSLEEHRSIDVDLNAAFARGLTASGKVRHLAFMSAMGANVGASATGSGAPGMARYSRVKGEAEVAMKNQGPAVVSIFRPAMIIGSRHTPWLLAAALPLLAPLTPAKFRSIRTTEIAKAMVATALHTPTQSAIYTYPEMMALIAGSYASQNEMPS